MAIYHCSFKIGSRSKGQSAVASASYRSGEKLNDERYGKVHNYTNREKSGQIGHSEIMLPENAPERFSNREILWNEVESVEKRKDSQLFREVEIALPKELSAEENIELVRDYVKFNFVENGMIADINIHEKEENPHAHIMLTTRNVSEYGFEEKNRDWNNKDFLEYARKDWENCINEKLGEKGIEDRVDCRSYEKQGIDKEPTIHMGVEAWNMEKRGIQSQRGMTNREIFERNRLREELSKLNMELEELEAKVDELAIDNDTEFVKPTWYSFRQIQNEVDYQMLKSKSFDEFEQNMIDRGHTFKEQDGEIFVSGKKLSDFNWSKDGKLLKDYSKNGIEKRIEGLTLQHKKSVTYRPKKLKPHREWSKSDSMSYLARQKGLYYDRKSGRVFKENPYWKKNWYGKWEKRGLIEQAFIKRGRNDYTALINAEYNTQRQERMSKQAEFDLKRQIAQEYQAKRLDNVHATCIKHQLWNVEQVQERSDELNIKIGDLVGDNVRMNSRLFKIDENSLEAEHIKLQIKSIEAEIKDLKKDINVLQNDVIPYLNEGFLTRVKTRVEVELNKSSVEKEVEAPLNVSNKTIEPQKEDKPTVEPKKTKKVLEKENTKPQDQPKKFLGMKIFTPEERQLKKLSNEADKHAQKLWSDKGYHKYSEYWSMGDVEYVAYNGYEDYMKKMKSQYITQQADKYILKNAPSDLNTDKIIKGKEKVEFVRREVVEEKYTYKPYVPEKKVVPPTQRKTWDDIEKMITQEQEKKATKSIGKYKGYEIKKNKDGMFDYFKNGNLKGTKATEQACKSAITNILDRSGR